MKSRVITFYSYTGGAGRTSTVANVAWVMAANGLRVLAVDMNFMSPSLHRYFQPYLPGRDVTLARTTGLFDLINDYALATVQPPPQELAADWYLPYADVEDHAFSIDYPFPGEGTLDLLVAGRQRPGYENAVSRFDWERFDEEQAGRTFMQAVRASMLEAYDYVLIESSVGSTAPATISTVDLAEAIMVCCRGDNASIEGGLAAARSIRRLRGPARPVDILPLLTNFDTQQGARSEATRRMTFSLFRDLMRPTDQQSESEYWSRAIIPRAPFFSFEEIPAALTDRYAEGALVVPAYENLTRLLVGADIKQLPALPYRERLNELGKFERPHLMPRPNRRTHLVISYVSQDRMWADWLRSELEGLQGADIRCSLLCANGRASAEGRENIDVLADSIPVVLLSKDFTEAPRSADLWEAFYRIERFRDDPWVVISLDNAVAPPPFSDQPSFTAVDKRPKQILNSVLAALNRPEPPLPANPGGTRFPRSVPDAIIQLPARYEAFFGRDDLLEQVRNELQENRTEVRAVVLHGLDGMGKNLVAREYGYRFAGDYDCIEYISAQGVGSAAGLRGSLVTVARRLGVPEAPTLHGVLESVLIKKSPVVGARRLLIIENLVDPKSLIDELPQFGSAHVILTSAQPAGSRALDLGVDVLPRYESIGLLTRRVENMDANVAAGIAELLEDFPLYLDSVASWLENSSTTPEEYRERLLSAPRQAIRLPFEQGGSRYFELASNPFTLTLDGLEEQNPAAARLVELCSAFGSGDIPRRLLESGEVKAKLDQERPREQHALGRLIEELGRRSFVRIESHETIDMHSLVQSYIQDWMDDPDRRERDRVFVRELVMGQPVPDSEEAGNWGPYQELWPQVRALALDAEGDQRDQVARFVRWAWRSGDWEGARALADKCIEKWTRVNGPDDEVLLRVRYHRVNILWSQAEFQRAADESADVLARLQKRRSPLHEAAIAAAQIHAASLRGLGRYDQALALDEETYGRLDQLQESDNPRLLNVASNLAVSHRLLGNYRSAESFDEETLRLRRRSLPDPHTWTLQSIANLGVDLRLMGRYRESTEQLQTAYDGLVNLLGEYHEDTVRTLNSLAVSSRLWGRFDEASELAAKAVQTAQPRFGVDHPDRLAIRLNLAAVEAAANKHDRARETANDVVIRLGRKLGETHPFTQIAKVNLAVYARWNDRALDARLMAADTVDALTEQLGLNHPWTLIARLNHSNHVAALIDPGTPEYDELLGDDKQIYETLLQKLTYKEHPVVSAAGHNYWLTMAAQGDDGTPEAHQIRIAVEENIIAAFGQNHPNSIAVRERSRIDVDLQPIGT